MVLEALAKLGVSGGIGFLLGLVAVWWVEPTTEGGIVLLIVIFAVAVTVIGGIVSRFKKKKRDNIRQTRAIHKKQSHAANGDDRTQLPEGLTRPAHWLKTEGPEDQTSAQPDDDGRARAAEPAVLQVKPHISTATSSSMATRPSPVVSRPSFLTRTALAVSFTFWKVPKVGSRISARLCWRTVGLKSISTRTSPPSFTLMTTKYSSLRMGTATVFTLGTEGTVDLACASFRTEVVRFHSVIEWWPGERMSTSSAWHAWRCQNSPTSPPPTLVVHNSPTNSAGQSRAGRR